MIVTHAITMDLVRLGVEPQICVMQNDSNTRQLQITMLAASTPWQPGDGITASVAYRKPGGTKGWYDTLPDGSAACTIQENTVSATLAPQMLTSAGRLDAAVVFMDADLNRIATFPLCIQIQKDPAAGGTVSNDYYNYSTMADINAQFASLEAELFAASSRLSQLDASASIVCDAAGEQITLTDASNRALPGLKVYGKTEQFTTTGAQLIPYSYKATTSTDNGVTFTDQGDHSYIVSGTATAIASVILGRPTLPAGTYTLSGSGSGTTVQINKSVDGVETALGVSKSGASATFTISEETTTIMYVIVPTNTTVSNVVVKPMLNSGSTALPFELYTGGSPAPNPDYPQALESVGAGGSVTVTVAGKNLLAKPFLIGVHTGTGYYSTNTGVISTDGFYLKAGTYVISGTFPSVSLTMFINSMKSATTTGNYQKYYSGRVFTIPADGLYNIQFNRNDDNTFTDAEIQALNSSAQVEFGDTATVYEPHKALQALTLSTPNGLPGIPVASGGNYTDENGQAWICDEVDFARGVYVQRISTVDMGNLTYNYNTDGLRFITTIGTMKYDGEIDYPVLSTCYRSQYNKGYGVSEDYAISTYYLYGRWIGIGDPRTTDSAELKELLTGETLMYIRQTPIETALSAEELAAYAALHTNHPNTTVYNDANAHMELSYVADTKAYIDNKFNELAAALVNNT